jgi:hypothetical protein
MTVSRTEVPKTRIGDTSRWVGNEFTETGDSIDRGIFDCGNYLTGQYNEAKDYSRKYYNGAKKRCDGAINFGREKRDEIGEAYNGVIKEGHKRGNAYDKWAKGTSEKINFAFSPEGAEYGAGYIWGKAEENIDNSEAFQNGRNRAKGHTKCTCTC